MTDELPPLPEPDINLHDGGTWMRSDNAIQAYGEACARAAAIAMRERCAKVCEDRAKFWDANAPEGDEHVYAYRQEEAAWCADAIRAETTVTRGES